MGFIRKNTFLHVLLSLDAFDTINGPTVIAFKYRKTHLLGTVSSTYTYTSVLVSLPVMCLHRALSHKLARLQCDAKFLVAEYLSVSENTEGWLIPVGAIRSEAGCPKALYGQRCVQKSTYLPLGASGGPTLTLGCVTAPQSFKRMRCAGSYLTEPHH